MAEPSTKRATAKWRVAALAIGVAAAIVVFAVAVGRLWARRWLVEGTCAVACHPAPLAMVGWMTIAALPPLILLLITRPPRTARGKRAVYSAFGSAVAIGLTTVPFRRREWQIARWLETDGPEKAFAVGVTTAMVGAFVSALAFLAALGLTAVVDDIRRARGGRSAKPVSVDRLAVPLVGLAVASSLAALVVAQLLVG